MTHPLTALTPLPSIFQSRPGSGAAQVRLSHQGRRHRCEGEEGAVAPITTHHDILPEFQYNSQIIEFGIQKVEPGNAVSIIECDVNIEFDAIDGMEEESRVGG